MTRPTREQVEVFEVAGDFRRWLAANHEVAPEIFVGFYKKGSTETAMSYPEAVDEALCFGWIDGIGYRIDDAIWANRFTRRRKRSNWSDANIKRVGELKSEGRMHPAGLAAFEARPPA